MVRTYAISEYGEVYYVTEDGHERLADSEDAEGVEAQLGYVYHDGEFLPVEEYELLMEEERDCNAPYHGLTYWECNPDFASW